MQESNSMNDPHVEWLRYQIVCGATLQVTGTDPVEYQKDRFNLRIEEQVLTVTMKEHPPTLESAREAIESFLRNWERENDLAYGPSALRFHYKHYGIVDRKPPPPGASQTIMVAGVASVSIV